MNIKNPIVTFLRPELWLVLYVFSPFYKAATLSWPFDVTLVSGLMLSLAIGFKLYSGGFRFNRRFGVVLLFWVALIVPLLYTTWDSYTEAKVFEVFVLSLLASLGGAIILSDRYSVELFFRWVVFMAAVVACFSIIELLRGDFGWRVQAFGISSIALGRGFGLALIILVYYTVVAESKRVRIASLLIAVLILIALISSANRQGLLGFVVASLMGLMLLALYKGLNRSMITKVLSFSVIAFGAYAFQGYLPQYALNRYDVTVAGSSDYSVSQRRELIDVALEGIVEHPFMGQGIGAFQDLGLGEQSRMLDSPHNLFLEIWYEFGIIPLLLVAFMCISVLVYYSLRVLSGSRIALVLAQVSVFLILVAMVGGITDKIFMCLIPALYINRIK